MSARDELADQLRAALPDSWDVLSKYAPPVELAAGRPCLMLWRDKLTPGPSMGTRSHALAAWLLTPRTDPFEVDDELDELLDELLPILDALPTVAWSEAERGTLDSGDGFPGYRVTLTFYTDKEAS